MLVVQVKGKCTFVHILTISRNTYRRFTFLGRSHEGQTNVAAEKRAKYAAIRHRMEDWCGGS